VRPDAERVGPAANGELPEPTEPRELPELPEPRELPESPELPGLPELPELPERAAHPFTTFALQQTFKCASHKGPT